MVLYWDKEKYFSLISKNNPNLLWTSFWSGLCSLAEARLDSLALSSSICFVNFNLVLSVQLFENFGLTASFLKCKTKKEIALHNTTQKSSKYLYEIKLFRKGNAVQYMLVLFLWKRKKNYSQFSWGLIYLLCSPSIRDGSLIWFPIHV